MPTTRWPTPRAGRLTALLVASLAACASSPPGPALRPALPLPISLSDAGWAALQTADPDGAAAIDRANAAWLCGYARADLAPPDAAEICGTP